MNLPYKPAQSLDVERRRIRGALRGLWGAAEFLKNLAEMRENQALYGQLRVDVEKAHTRLTERLAELEPKP